MAQDPNTPANPSADLPARRPPDPARYRQAPRGTRDFYPLEMAKRRWIEERWRRVAIRHGFEEIDGPRFEHLDTYTVKSGEGIVSELFSFRRAGGETDFALRPEFTPTLARMVAARANSLPKPTKWFSIGPYFRAERPQRGRLREFLQWNVDVVGDDSPQADAEVIACCVEFLRECGLGPGDVKVRISSRTLISEMLQSLKVPSGLHAEAMSILDRRGKISEREFAGAFHHKFDLSLSTFDEHVSERQRVLNGWLADGHAPNQLHPRESATVADMPSLLLLLREMSIGGFVEIELSIVRGLAYYTGTVFEVHEATGAERAIAGGGRYDNLVELFGGPPTPAVGFAMGDVVLSLVLQDKGLMPGDAEIARELRLDPDVFVVSMLDAQEGAPDPLASALARLRREGLHARRTYKSTKNIGKLLKEAGQQRARIAMILEGDGAVTLKDLGGESGAQEKLPNLDDAISRVHEMLRA